MLLKISIVDKTGGVNILNIGRLKLLKINRKYLIIAWIIFTFLSTFYAFAQEKHQRDKSLEECIAKNSSTQEMCKCGENALKQWDAELNKYYKLLMSILSTDAKKGLKKSQLAWIKFRDLEFGFLEGENSYFQDFGSYIGPTIISNKNDIVEARALELKSYYDTIMAGK